MKTFNFFTDLPSRIPETASVYSLEWKHRFDVDASTPIPAQYDGIRFVVIADEEIAGTEFSIPIKDEQLMFAREGAGPGTGGRMRLLLSARKLGLTREEFTQHWRTVHTPMVLASAPYFDCYVSNICDDSYGLWDGVLQQWFADVDSFDAHEAGFTGIKSDIADDYPKFLNSSADCVQWLATEVASAR